MSATPDSTLADPQQIIADLQRQLAECKAERDECKTERDEALQRETATAEVLQVINSSPGDLAPVFEAMLEKAARLCEAAHGNLWTYDGERFYPAATYGSPRFAEWLCQRGPVLPPSGSVFERIVRGERFVQISDAASDNPYLTSSWSRQVVEITGARTTLVVPLRKDNALLGAIFAYRQEVRPFTDKQIALLQNFAAQAVIAMENARLITETREVLDRQTATSEVLGIISSSSGRLEPVFDAILASAVRVCAGKTGMLALTEDGGFRGVAVHGVGSEFASTLSQLHHPPPRTGLDLLQKSLHSIQIADCAAEPAYDAVRALNPAFAAVRTALHVPMIKEGELLGAIAIYHDQVRPFDDKEVELVENFAKQAVIAIENTRLITEIREALGQQTATAEVLRVINSSPGNLAPVFDAMLEKATRLCEAPFGILRTWDGERFHFGAVYGDPRFSDWVRQRGPFRPDRDESLLGRILAGERVVHFSDAPGDEGYRTDTGFRKMVEASGIRSATTVALHKDDALLGTITVYRQEVRPFTDKQIALLQNFAAQAVIAMENARLITETREALEQQTATAEVLQVINSSPGVLAPVFDTLLEKAMRLCEAAFGEFIIAEGERVRAAAVRGAPAAFAEIRMRSAPPTPGSIMARVLAGEAVIHTVDARDDDLYRRGDPHRLVLVDLAGARSTLAVTLIKDGAVLGAIHIYRQEVRPFTDKQIALLQNFAAQAVIAMENARLLTETREALEQQTATAEVLQVINSSPGDLAPVFDAMLEKATRLCEAPFGILRTWDGERFHFGAVHGEPWFSDWVRQRHPLRQDRDGSPLGRIVADERVVSFADALGDQGYRASSSFREMAEASGLRSAIWVALHKDDALLGTITVYRQEVRPFSDKQIALLQNFAAQAVIAIENARLITETREALEQQTATAEILEVINRSPGDLAPVFDTMLDKALRLCDAAYGNLLSYDGESFHPVAVHGDPRLTGWLPQHGSFRPGPGTTNYRIVLGERIVHVPDVVDDEPYRQGDPIRRALVEIGGCRALLSVALRKDDALFGVIHVYRTEARPFSSKQIGLLESFAAQAVIAMDNARLLDEIRQRQAELRVTFDNMGDGVAMFDGELRLAAWNLNFQRILDLPDTLLAERPSYPDYIRFLAERGEFGAEGIAPELSRRLEATDQELRLERARPDGRIVEIRRNAVPGGGFVTIYSDITERKRAEEEIHAARDTAERALRELQAAQASLLHAQKMAALGQLTAGIAHEIKNPLNFVNNFAGLSVELLDELKTAAAPAIAALDDDARADIDETVGMLTGNLEKIAEHGKRADGIVKSMLEHSRGVSGERRAVDLNALIEEALNLGYHGARAQDASFNITLERDFDHGLAPTELAPQEMTRAFLNLFGNGFYATTKRQRDGAGPDFRPTLTVATRDLGDAVEVRVRDNGTGIAPEIRDKLFQPFVTTKPTGEGTGLGLSIAYDIVTQQHGGTIEVHSTFGQFTEFTIRLPRTHRTTAEAAS